MTDTRKAPARVVVVGGANVDLQGKSTAPFIPGDSNPGRIARACGGVGRNIAENCARLGMPTWLIAAFGDDQDGAFLADSCERAGIDMGGSLRAHAPTPRYLCALGPDGALQAAVADMAAMELLTPEFLETRRPYLDAADILIADANLPAPSLAWLAATYGREARPRGLGRDREGGPILFLDPVSATKAAKALGLTAAFDCVKPNLGEAAILAGLRRPAPASGSAKSVPPDPEALCRALAEARAMPAELFISLGEEGMYYSEAAGPGRVEPLPPPELRLPPSNRSGAGDAACAALAWAWSRGLPIREKARAALTAAMIAAASPEPVSPEMNEETLVRAMRRMFREE
ncbi:PfkB family carbohydrate kinase [bacterium]|nr:PfkB family carbohydrate kinase [bacterium]